MWLRCTTELKLFVMHRLLLITSDCVCPAACGEVTCHVYLRPRVCDLNLVYWLTVML